MKPIFKFFLILLGLFVALLAVDFLIGRGLDKMINDVPDQSEVGLTHLSIKKVETPIIIIGSSRARHHYNTRQIQDSLGMPAYTIARDAHFVSYQSCVLNAVLDRYTPKIVLWECSMNTLFSKERDAVHSLHPYYYECEALHDIIDKKEGPTMAVKMCLNTYRYNGVASNIILQRMSRANRKDTLQGFLPFSGKLKGADTLLKAPEVIADTVDPVKVEIFTSTIKRLKEKGTTVILFDSPIHELENPDQNKASELTLKGICEQYGVPVFDNRHLEEFQHNTNYFYDPTHISKEGTTVYTPIVIQQIKSVLNGK